MQIRKIFPLCLALSFVAHQFCYAAVTEVPAEQPQIKSTVDATTIKSTQPAESKRLFMWKVTSPKGKSAYLVGSIHLVRPDFYPLPAEMEKAFADSTDLVLEIDETKTDPSTLQTFMTSSGIYMNGDMLINHVSKETAKELQKYLTEISKRTLPVPVVPGNAAVPSAINQGMVIQLMRPWLASMMIPMMELQTKGFDPASGIDRHFLEEAVAAKKSVGELESTDFQLKLISSFPDDLQDKLLLAALLDVAETDKDAAKMVHAWKVGDPQEMQAIVSKETKEHPELKPVMEKLLVDRNVDMEKKVEQYLDSDKRYFVVVGAAHLIGKNGLLKMLSDKGYTVEQVSAATKD